MEKFPVKNSNVVDLASARAKRGDRERSGDTNGREEKGQQENATATLLKFPSVGQRLWDKIFKDAAAKGHAPGLRVTIGADDGPEGST